MFRSHDVMWLRPMPLDLLDEFVEGGYLAPAARDAMPTSEVTPLHLDWSPESAEPSEAGACVHTSSSCKSPWI